MHARERTLRDRPRRPGVRASVVASTVGVAIAHGVPMERIGDATGLTAADLADPEGWLPEAVLPPVWRLLAEACPGRAIAIEMAASAPMSFFGPLVHVCRHAADLRAVLRAFARYRFVLSDNLHIELAELPGEAQLRMHHPLDAAEAGRGAEMGFGVAVRLGREIMGEDPGLLRVELRHAAPGPARAYEDFFGAPVLFERPRNMLVIRPEALDRPTRHPDAELCRFIQRHLDEALARLRPPERVEPEPLAQVREAVARNAERAEYGADALARSLGMSLRNLQRLVRAHGTHVRVLLEEAREASARQLLGDRRLSVEEVSFLLGYSDDRAFRRAFKRWTGRSPAEARRTPGPPIRTA